MAEKTVAFLVMEDMSDFVTDFHLAIEPLGELGWQVETVAWRTQHEWDRFDAVYICTPWDYPQFPDEFLQVLAAIDASSAALCNAMSIVQWNLDKSYLKDVEARGERIVPSTWYAQFSRDDVAGYFREHCADTVVLKPTVGGNAVDTFVLRAPVPDATLATLEQLFENRTFLVQPYIASITTEGEYSLFYMNGQYSHAIGKVPAKGDFRVQEEHGADIRSVEPPPGLREVAERVFSHIQPLPVYGRGDWVRGPDGEFLLMELELIEPSLYLRTDALAPTRFARAFDEWFQILTGE
ncbi:MAG: hypothetical protein QNJ14_17800 [Woeseiaceae bacterium]|nr:hypothetical protein [Woeseiaceae bacterium]